MRHFEDTQSARRAAQASVARRCMTARRFNGPIKILIQSYRTAGMSYVQIAARLNKLGYRTRQMREYNDTQIWRILNAYK